jgi:hypothetical protein
MASAQVNPPDFTVVVLPDPQNETQYFPQVLNSQTKWIVNNQKALNIQMVLTEGDNINDGASTAQLQNLDAAFRLLENAGVPYLLAIGNHDYNGFNPKASRNLTGFNQWFGPGRFAGKTYFKGNFPTGSNANSYAVLPINGQQYLFITLEYRPTSTSLDWAESILAANPDKEVIVVDHSFVLKNNKREDLCDDQDMPASNATGQGGLDAFKEIQKRDHVPQRPLHWRLRRASGGRWRQRQPGEPTLCRLSGLPERRQWLAAHHHISSRGKQHLSADLLTLPEPVHGGFNEPVHADLPQ